MTETQYLTSLFQFQSNAQEEYGVRYFHLTERKTIGEKRNLAVSNALGDIIVHWDDDDFFRPHRISSQVGIIFYEQERNTMRIYSVLIPLVLPQVQPILDGEVDMTVLEHHLYLHAPNKAFYTVKRASR